jgi:hypothetical protein
MNDNQIDYSGNRSYKGTLFVAGDNNCWISIQKENTESETIKIECDNLVDKLLDHVPCRIGGNYLYEEKSEISAILMQDGDKYVLGNLDMIRIVREDEEFEVLL